MITYTAYASVDAPNWWPNRLPSASLDYALDITPTVDPNTDVIESVSLAIAPSGSGEAVASNLVSDGQLISVTLSSGQPTRIYTINITVTMTDGRVFEYLVYQGIPPGLPGFTIPIPPAPGYGTPITYP